MDIASMVLGIISAVFGFIPFCNVFALVPAIIGLVLGIVDVAIKASKNKKLNGESKFSLGIGISGIALSAVAIIIIILWTIVITAASKNPSI